MSFQSFEPSLHTLNQQRPKRLSVASAVDISPPSIAAAIASASAHPRQHRTSRWCRDRISASSASKDGVLLAVVQEQTDTTGRRTRNFQVYRRVATEAANPDAPVP
ncbi:MULTISPECIES: hypothetical protein [Cyanophyceae]|uniref:hypothetical protein n=1 Tax=Cyanophyceae TaxID=3028117 RepID=UPI001681E38D|nr:MULTISPECIES: hypothetical protein [Cyanophyceae]MBD1918084.1 hypothetical protein [Phormidium sp. FACHB-77]MBD2030116.1 hypothetical protein [Phormidium sp. FACHB-322]MBD2051512.1 hypothetical protein [Leptolyngbya sp. FACHB-60]